VVTSTENVYWMRPHRIFEQDVISSTTKGFQKTGIYEVVSQDDIKAALGGRQVLMKTDWARKNWALARQVGRAVHAEYAIFVERSQSMGNIYSEMVLINTETEKKFRVLGRSPAVHYIAEEEYKRIFGILYLELFRKAKEDMLATAIRKGRLMGPGISVSMTDRPALPPVSTAVTVPRPSPPTPLAESSPVEKPVVVARPETPTIPKAPALPEEKALPGPPPGEAPKPPAAPPVSIGQPTPAEKPVAIVKAEPPPIAPSPVSPPSAAAEPTVAKASPPEISLSPRPDQPSSFTAESHVDLEKDLQTETRVVEGRRRLAVYDLEAVEQYKIVALILSEALREELFKLEHFQLVNRENIVKVLEEMALQQTGLVDEKEAIKAGKGLAVQQIVLGRYGTLGKMAILQAKRVDVETQGALGLGSLKCVLGREDELLQHMAELARAIAGEK